MSTLPGNPHYENAYFTAEQVPSNQQPEFDAAVATTYATLALAHEQRTANLIAERDSRARAYNQGSLESDGIRQLTALNSQIAVRLGLEAAT
jgi:hypothetical protein